MANSYKNNPIFLDTFSGDLDIANLAFGLSDVPVFIKKIVFHDPTAADKVILKDSRGNVVAELECAVTDTIVQKDFPQPWSCLGLKLLTADQTVTTGSVLIYV